MVIALEFMLAKNMAIYKKKITNARKSFAVIDT